MLKSQYAVLIIAVLAVVALAFLPKVVVNDGDRALNEEEGTENTAPPTGANGESNPGSVPSIKIDEAAQTELTELRLAMQQAQSVAQQLSITDKISDIFEIYGKYDSAAAYYESLFEETESIEAQFKAGKQYYEAMMVAMSAEELASHSEKVRTLLGSLRDNVQYGKDAKVMVGMTYVQSENPMQGVMMIREVIQEDPEHKGALLNLGLLSLQSGQTDKAVQRLEKLKSLDEGDAKARFYLGIAYYETNQPEKALQELKYVQEHSDNPQILGTASGLIKELEQ